MRTVAIINQKGGCGKTTTSINLAACMARLGQKTLLVDFDPQGHCGVGLAVPEDQIERTILDTLIEPADGKPASVKEIAWQIASDFDLVPSNIKLASFEQLFAGRDGREDRLRNALSGASNHYQWCIIDCPPSVGLLTFNALRACDEVIVPVETGFFSLHGLAKMMETLELMTERCSHQIQIRVLPTLYDTRTKLAREVLSELRNKFHEYLMDSTVNFNTKLKEAASFGQPITEYDPGSRGYKDFVNLARELMGHRPIEAEPQPMEKLSRPAELVQRARQLAQLANYQLGRNTVTLNSATAGGTHGELAAQPSSTHGGRLNFNTDDAIEALDAFASATATVAAVSVAPTVRKSTAQKIEEFYGVKQVGDQTIFAARFTEADEVLLAGDFNNWTPTSTPMLPAGNGQWRMTLPLEPGRYRYRLVVDGQWITDPHNQYVEANEYGELNNVIEVE
ncbi:MAG: AAA family ATPase [Phycisphaerales bacterium]|nr:AAA family ATPase [Phycisphaerales bacterium]